MTKLALNILGYKGLKCLEAIITNNYHTLLDITVFIGRDVNIKNDFADEIIDRCIENKIGFSERLSTQNYTVFDYVIAIGWRWMIKGIEEERLIVFHDSLLPRYRGFAPLVNAALNKDKVVGVTALFGAKRYDEGDIIAQSSVNVDYPISISELIELISPCYVQLLLQVFSKLSDNKKLPRNKQNSNEATYSIWLDEYDYFIDWNESAENISHKINLLGNPYKNARAKVKNSIVVIKASEVYDDLKVERRHIGKVLMVEQGCPVIICGSGLIKLTSVFDESEQPLLPFNQLRVRFQ